VSVPPPSGVPLSSSPHDATIPVIMLTKTTQRILGISSPLSSTSEAQQ
jgi:hypothetical protein